MEQATWTQKQLHAFNFPPLATIIKGFPLLVEGQSWREREGGGRVGETLIRGGAGGERERERQRQGEMREVRRGKQNRRLFGQQWRSYDCCQLYFSSVSSHIDHHQFNYWTVIVNLVIIAVIMTVANECKDQRRSKNLQ